MRLLLLLVLLAGCKNTVPVEVSEIVALGSTLTGTVQSVDMDPMAYDGDGLVAIETAQGMALTVHIPARMGLCEAEGLALGPDLKPGDRIEVKGEVQGSEVYLCTDPDHFLRRAR